MLLSFASVMSSKESSLTFLWSTAGEVYLTELAGRQGEEPDRSRARADQGCCDRITDTSRIQDQRHRHSRLARSQPDEALCLRVSIWPPRRPYSSPAGQPNTFSDLACGSGSMAPHLCFSYDPSMSYAWQL